MLSSKNIQSAFGFVSADRIFVDEKEVATRAKSTLPAQTIPSVLIYPESCEEVQTCVRVAAELNLPLWYVSTGKNWGYGCKAAPYPGGVTLVLEKMNRILEVNTKLGYAVIEPGVTYQQLNEYLEKNNIPLWTDAAGTTMSASVIGNALDKGRGLTPYADHLNALIGFDVVLPDGSLMQTSPHKSFKSRHIYKWSIGPYVDGLFAQSNLGVVVRSGVLLMPKPEEFDFFAFEYTAPREKFSAFIEDFRELFFQKGILCHPHLANDFAMLCIVDRYPDHLVDPSRGYLDEQALESWKRQHGIKDWTFGGGLYGTKMQIAAQKSLVKKYLGPYGTLRFIGAGVKPTMWGKFFRQAVMLGARLAGKSDEFVKQIFPAIDLFRGKPTDDFAKQVYFKSKLERPKGPFDPAQDNCGFVWTGPLVPFTAEDVDHIMKIARPIFERYKYDFFVELIVESPRTLIALFGVFFDPQDTDDRERAQAWYEELREKSIEAGYSPYRETSYSTTGALDGNPELSQFLNQIKATVDPMGILAPGRYGIGRSPKGRIKT